jgi:hypothetical protein
MLGAALVSFLPTSKPTENHRHLLNRVGAHRSQSRAAQIVHPAACSNPRCSIVAFDDGAGMNGASALEDKQIVAIFEEFDTSGDGFIDLGELEAALSRAGKRVSREEVSISLDHLCAHMTTNTCAVLVLHTLPGTANLGSSGREQGWADLSR